MKKALILIFPILLFSMSLLKAEIVTGVCTLYVFQSYNFGDSACQDAPTISNILPIRNFEDTTYNIQNDITLFIYVGGGYDPSFFLQIYGFTEPYGDSTSCINSIFYTGDREEARFGLGVDFNFITRQGNFGFAKIIGYEYLNYIVISWKIQTDGSKLLTTTALQDNYYRSDWGKIKNLFR